MFKRPLVKPMLGAAALIALGALLPVSSANAGPASCSAYARDVAASEAPRRGLIDGVVIGTLDTVFTGGAGADHRYRRIYNEAYSECMDRDRVAYVPRARAVIKQYRAEPTVVSNYRTQHVVVSERPEVGSEDWVAYCSAKYRSFDPDTGTYVSYEGETVPCR
ncbi:BA14K family protein [Taklimakanibacter deserti]|uniref:BA14K family protein n=1 Tax=Taklimakanibacter deserti TaxID=2267839 RepID=UPI0013C517CD